MRKRAVRHFIRAKENNLVIFFCQPRPCAIFITFHRGGLHHSNSRLCQGDLPFHFIVMHEPSVGYGTNNIRFATSSLEQYSILCWYAVNSHALKISYNIEAIWGKNEENVPSFLLKLLFFLSAFLANNVPSLYSISLRDFCFSWSEKEMKDIQHATVDLQIACMKSLKTAAAEHTQTAKWCPRWRASRRRKISEALSSVSFLYFAFRKMQPKELAVKFCLPAGS